MAAEVHSVASSLASHLANDLSEVQVSELRRQSRKSRTCKNLDDHFEAVMELIAVAIDESNLVDTEDALGILRSAMSWSTAPEPELELATATAPTATAPTAPASDSCKASGATETPQLSAPVTVPVAAPVAAPALTSPPLAIKDEKSASPGPRLGEAAAVTVEHEHAQQGVIEIEDDEGDEGDKGEGGHPPDPALEAPEGPNDPAGATSAEPANPDDPTLPMPSEPTGPPASEVVVADNKPLNEAQLAVDEIRARLGATGAAKNPFGAGHTPSPGSSAATVRNPVFLDDDDSDDGNGDEKDKAKAVKYGDGDGGVPVDAMVVVQTATNPNLTNSNLKEVLVLRV